MPSFLRKFLFAQKMGFEDFDGFFPMLWFTDTFLWLFSFCEREAAIKRIVSVQDHMEKIPSRIAERNRSLIFTIIEHNFFFLFSIWSCSLTINKQNSTGILCRTQNLINKKNFSRQSNNNNKFRDRPHMIQAEFENGIEDENNFQIQEIDFQNGIDEDGA